MAVLGTLSSSLALSGCATLPIESASARPAGLPSMAGIPGVPHFPDRQAWCGPAALAAVLTYAGLTTHPAALAPRLWIPKRAGSLQIELLAAARAAGALAMIVPPALDQALRLVADDLPVVALLNIALPIAPQWHYVVLTGYDLDDGSVTMHSGEHAHQPLRLSTFDRLWARSERWAMIALAPGRIPAGIGPDRHLAAAIALERARPGAARLAYASAASRWPDQRLAWLGLGNTSWTTGDPAGAEHAYRAWLARDPSDGDTWNNLANLLAALGRKREAREAATRAVGLGGANAGAYQRTLEELIR